jgi:hypothetical protein
MDAVTLTILEDIFSLKMKQRYDKRVLLIKFNYLQCKCKCQIWHVSILSILFVCLMVFNVTFNNISAISWQSVLLVEEIGGPRENHYSISIRN